MARPQPAAWGPGRFGSFSQTFLVYWRSKASRGILKAVASRTPSFNSFRAFGPVRARFYVFQHMNRLSHHRNVMWCESSLFWLQNRFSWLENSLATAAVESWPTPHVAWPQPQWLSATTSCGLPPGLSWIAHRQGVRAAGAWRRAECGKSEATVVHKHMHRYTQTRPGSLSSAVGGQV